MTEQPDREQALAAVARIATNGIPAITITDLGLLAQSLLSIAETAMPDTAFAVDSRCQLARAIQLATLNAAHDGWFDDTCGDCVEGRCHWGGEKSRLSTEMATAGQDYEDPVYGRCRCARHDSSVTARAYQRDTFDATALAWQAAKDAGDVEPHDNDNDTIWISRPPVGPTSEGRAE